MKPNHSGGMSSRSFLGVTGPSQLRLLVTQKLLPETAIRLLIFLGDVTVVSHKNHLHVVACQHDYIIITRKKIRLLLELSATMFSIL